jgi:hypothetical protein
MHPENRYYGHGRILTGTLHGEAPAAVRGHVQHGWSTGHGFGPPSRLVSWLPRLGWGDRTGVECRAAGLPGVTLIGAPFVYLTADVDPARPKPRATVVYPFHGTERLALSGSHDRMADEVAEREDGPVTICLYWSDHTPDAVAAYERHGFTVTTHGHRSDPLFLERQLDLLLGHDRIVTNRVGTAFWYGASLGLEAEIYGPYFGLDHLTGLDGPFERYQRAQWPDFHEGPCPGREAKVVGDAELGTRHRRHPEELRMLIAPDRGSVRRRLEPIVARGEWAVRRGAVHALALVPGLAGVDATALPADLSAYTDGANLETARAR